MQTESSDITKLQFNLPQSNSLVEYYRDKFAKNQKKSRPLEMAVATYCVRLFTKYRLDFKNLTYKHNFKNSVEHHTADFTINSKMVIECKQWDCVTYTITMEMATEEILSRFQPFVSYPHKVLVISKPKWGLGVKEFLEANGTYVLGTQGEKEHGGGTGGSR